MSIKTVSFLIALSLLCACGFSPMYGKNATTTNASIRSNLDQINIAIIPNREGQFLRNLLIDKFYNSGYPATPLYNLRISTIRENVVDFDITIDSDATRRQLTLTTKMALVDIQTKKSVLTRDISAITSYNVLESEYSTIVTEQSARDAALTDIARKVEQQIVLYLNR